MNLEAKGTIHIVKDAEQITERFRKREFVVLLEGKPEYPQYVLFEATGDRCEQLDGYAPGDAVEIEFALRGREWLGAKDGVPRYFNSLQAWAVRGNPSGTVEEPQPEAPSSFDDEDVPF